MLEQVKRFLKEEDGMGTVEIILILAVLVSIALIFRKQIIEFVNNALKSILGDSNTQEGTTIKQ